MEIPHQCRICEKESQSPEFVRVPGATRDVMTDTFTVWRCRHCSTLNALEKVDYAKIYKNYPIQRQNDDFFAKRLFSKRLKILVHLGLRPYHTILDYGCGSGHFVRYLRGKKYHCNGFDPYNASYCDTSVLKNRYDVVTCQDVIEHVDEPKALLCHLADFVAPNGCLIVGTPYADHVNIHDTLDQIGALHQPFHRFLISKQAAGKFFKLDGWKLENIHFASYFDTAYPFVNTMFLFHLIESGKGPMDFVFDPIPFSHFIRNPKLLFWGFFGRLFARSQDIFVVMRK